MVRGLSAAIAVAVVALTACASPIRLASPAETSQAGKSNAPAAQASPAAPSTTPLPNISPPTGSGALSQFQDQLRQLAAQVSASVVEVRAGNGLGSGIVMDTAGHVVTNAHVVAGASSYTVTTADGHQYNASLAGSYDNGDLAVLTVALADGLVPATFGDSSKVAVGDIVLAVGAPYGLAGSVTEGIVSGVGRTETEDTGVTLNGLIQTSAAINPGNSGGALVGLDGKVIGIPTLAATPSPGRNNGTPENIGFAIPSNQVVNVAAQLIATGSVSHTGRAFLGVTVSGSNGGATIQQVAPGGPANKAGIQAGWLITAIDSHLIPDSDTLTQVLTGYKPGDKVTLDLTLPDGSTKQVTLTLGERPVTP
jgi:S1-C subfamily serine protease